MHGFFALPSHAIPSGYAMNCCHPWDRREASPFNKQGGSLITFRRALSHSRVSPCRGACRRARLRRIYRVTGALSFPLRLSSSSFTTRVTPGTPSAMTEASSESDCSQT